MGGFRGAFLILVLALLVLAAGLSGCVAKKEESQDQVIRSWSRDKPTDRTSEVTFIVPKDTERLKFAVSTKPAKDSSGDDWWASCARPPFDCSGGEQDETPSGYVSVNLWDPNNAVQGSIKLNYDSSDSIVIPEPVAGTWLAKISYASSYDGPVALTASEPVPVSGGLGSFWDIFGVVLAIVTLVGGWFLYRRRGRFLSREMHRIDALYSHKTADIEECRTNLEEMKTHLGELLVRRKIEESQYLILERRIDQYLVDLDTPGNRHRAGSTVEGSKEETPGAALERIRKSNG